jgi:hypothetical protein
MLSVSKKTTGPVRQELLYATEAEERVEKSPFVPTVYVPFKDPEQGCA